MSGRSRRRVAAPRPVDQEQHGSVGRQPARHQVVEQRPRHRRGLGGTLAQSEDVFAPLRVNPQEAHTLEVLAAGVSVFPFILCCLPWLALLVWPDIETGR